MFIIINPIKLNACCNQILSGVLVCCDYCLLLFIAAPNDSVLGLSFFKLDLSLFLLNVLTIVL